jgi:hypothetical protein
MMSTANPTRGERNFNPGNIDRNTIKWKGMAPDQSGDSRFIVFSAAVWGIRALARNLLTYSRLYEESDPRDIDTVREIINRWAPPVENDTGAYVNAVAREVGVLPDEPIDVADEAVMRKLVKAIIHHENGRCIYTDYTIGEGVMLALA